MTAAAIEARLRETVHDLLAGGKVDFAVGHVQGSLPGRSRPGFIADADESAQLVWNSGCANNLAVYLQRYFVPPARPPKVPVPLPRIGLVAKGCDMRSLDVLVKEKQVPRENIVVIGMPCQGMHANGGVGDAVSGPPEELLLAACRECPAPVPSGADILLEGEGREAAAGGSAAREAFAARSPGERWEYFESEMRRCIKCYACRQACPNCYCKECFADQSKPRWVSPGNDLSDVMLYHIGRVFHQAGRCVGCDACARACPMDIDLRTFTQQIVADVKDLFGYTPGLAGDEVPPLSTFRDNDRQDFITEP